MRLELVRDWMSRELITIIPETGVVEAEKLLRSHDIRRLPVVENGRLTGIITHTDICAVRPSSVEVVGQIMAGDPVTVSPDATIGEAAQLLLENKIGGLPVLAHDGNLVGIITESDIFRLVVHDWIHASGDPTEPYARYS